MRELADVVADGNILRLVEKFLRAGVMEGGRFQRTRVGTPQGGVASPLLANIALNVLRCMKLKRKSKVDNYRVRLKHLRRMGLLSLSELRLQRVAGS